VPRTTWLETAMTAALSVPELSGFERSAIWTCHGMR
jgi:hypothetical protein